jgi:hypothetical protein
VSDKTQAAIGKFFLRIGQVKTSSERRCEWTMPLFPLPLILDADGTLAEDARYLVTDKSDIK